jgi:ABC-type Co2+ transport system permease subunit
MQDETGKPTDLRGRRRREQRRLFGIVVAFLIVVGSVAITLAYGSSAAVLGLGCLLIGATVLGLLWLILLLIERLAK